MTTACTMLVGLRSNLLWFIVGIVSGYIAGGKLGGVVVEIKRIIRGDKHG